MEDEAHGEGEHHHHHEVEAEESWVPRDREPDAPVESSQLSDHLTSGPTPAPGCMHFFPGCGADRPRKHGLGRRGQARRRLRAQAPHRGLVRGDVQEVVREVGQRVARRLCAAEGGAELVHRAHCDWQALVHEEGAGELFKGALRGLVDAEHDHAVLRREALQRGHEAVRRGRVEAGRRLIEEQHARRRDHAHGDGDPPPLPPRDSLRCGRAAAQLRVGDVPQPQRPEGRVHGCGALLSGALEGQRHLRREGHRLARRERQREVVFLANVSDHCRQANAVRGDGVAVEEHVSRAGRAGGHDPRHGVQERCLARATGANDAVDVPAVGSA
mmetsp:Transcript_15998/g.43128  ORF Transcript_15998/g.43128 Transcript_15998/m.43128 type:complete len:329 (+) Transcript_15998:932-1918(+)